MGVKEYQNAIAAFTRARGLNPSNANSYLLYVNALEQSGDKQKAVEALQDFKKQFPSVQGVDEQIKRIQTS